MKISQIREFSDEELQVEMDRIRRHIFDLRAQSVTEKLEDTSQITKARRDIARIRTVVLQRQRQAQGSVATAGA
jgi:large subunit ribosomal protein L29